MSPGPLDILDFWWQAGPARWFAADPAFDAEIKSRFGACHAEAAAGGLDAWASTADGALALILLLDQVSRNLYRDDARAFAQDDAARTQAQEACRRGFDRAYPLPARRFFYMPFMHAETMADQERCIDLCRAARDREGVDFALRHMDVIRRFGRFPSRNRALGRATTPAEEAWLAATASW